MAVIAGVERIAGQRMKLHAMMRQRHIAPAGISTALERRRERLDDELRRISLRPLPSIQTKNPPWFTMGLPASPFAVTSTPCVTRSSVTASSSSTASNALRV